MGEPKKKLRRPAARTEQSEQEDPEKKVQQEKEQGVVAHSRDAPEERHDVEPGEKLQQKPARTGRSQHGEAQEEIAAADSTDRAERTGGSREERAGRRCGFARCAGRAT